MDNYVIGVDYGTDSVRAVLMNTSTGSEEARAVFSYPRWKKQLYCNAGKQQFRQHPLDYTEGLTAVVTQCVSQVSNEVKHNIVGLSIDTTGSTPAAVNKQGVPLALLPGFSENPNAMFFLWKDHTGTQEAADINEHAKKFDTNYLQYVGGIYSSEWYWAKLLRLVREDEDVTNALYSWVEQCDWLPFMLCGGNDADEIKRGVCSAGHKALWAEEYGGFPPEDFFSGLDEKLVPVLKTLPRKTYTSAEPAGKLSKEWAEKLNLPEGITIGIGAFDAHMGAVGGEIEPYYLSKVMGTSTCDMLVAPNAGLEGKVVKGICGQVDGSIIPDMLGLEAGQSAFGDVYAWFKQVLLWPLYNLNYDDSDNDVITSYKQKLEDDLLKKLSEEANKIEPDVNSVYAIDWLNGRRTPDASQEVTATIANLKIGTNAPEIFRALVESTCFGAKAIVERFIDEGVPVKGIIGLGGVARKSPFIMQMMSDVLEMPIRIHSSEQTCALGAAMFAATAAGVFKNVEDAMKAMGKGFDKFYEPNPEYANIYRSRYNVYKQLGKQTEEILAKHIQ